MSLPPENHGVKSAEKTPGTHQGKEEGKTLVVPVVGAWDADYCYAVVVPERPARD